MQSEEISDKIKVKLDALVIEKTLEALMDIQHLIENGNNKSQINMKFNTF